MELRLRVTRRLLVGALLIAASCSESTKPPVATRLEFEAQPMNSIAGAVIGPQVRVRVLDAAGNRFTGPTAAIDTLRLERGDAA
jgi:hypothetical protein